MKNKEEFELTISQNITLMEHDYSPRHKGAYIDLYASDFEKEHIWKEICEQTGVSYPRSHVTLFYVGVK